MLRKTIQDVIATAFWATSIKVIRNKYDLK